MSNGVELLASIDVMGLDLEPSADRDPGALGALGSSSRQV
jgi:hypothetical protein